MSYYQLNTLLSQFTSFNTWAIDHESHYYPQFLGIARLDNFADSADTSCA